MASGVTAGTAPAVAFSRHGGIYRSDVSFTSCKPGPAYRFPAGSGPGIKARRKETRLPVSAYSKSRYKFEEFLRCLEGVHCYYVYAGLFRAQNIWY